MTYFTCRYSGLSPNCTTFINNRAPCQWIDITNVDALSNCTLSLSLEPGLNGTGIGLLDETLHNFSFIPLSVTEKKSVSTLRIALVEVAFVLPVFVGEGLALLLLFMSDIHTTV
jgi:hypothetical protein